MKRAIALLVTLLMVLSLFPMSALAEGESTDTPTPAAVEETATPEPTAAPEETPVPEDTATPEPSITPEATVTEALASESPSMEALFLRLLDCDSLDADGTGHTDVLCLAGDALGLKVKAETNGELSYRWQVLDQASTADDPYVDISTSDEPTADEKELSVLADAAVLGVADYYRCVVTATLGEETVVSESYFTLKSSDPTAKAEVPMLPTDGLDLSVAGATVNVASFSDLILAISGGAAKLVLTADIEVTNAYEIPATVTIEADGFALSVAADKTLTNKGLIQVKNTGSLVVNGTLDNSSGRIMLLYGATLDVSSGTYIDSTKVHLDVIDTGVASNCSVTGIANNYISYSYYATNEAELLTGLAQADNGYRRAEVDVKAPITLYSSVTVPENVSLVVNSAFTIDEKAVLTVDGTLYVPEFAGIINNGAIIYHGLVEIYGGFTLNGTISGDGTYYNPGTVGTEAELREAISAGKSLVAVQSSFALASSLTIPANVTLFLAGYTLVVPSGKTLQVDGQVMISDAANVPARLIIQNNATLKNNGLVEAYSGALILESGSSYVSDTGSLNQYTYTGASITGIAKSKITVICKAEDDSMLRTALAFGGKGYAKIKIDLLNSISLASDLVLPVEAYLTIGMGNYAVTLTVPYGKKLTNNGEIYINPGDTLQIDSGATLINTGKIQAYGNYINNGKLTNTGTITTGDVVIDTWDDFLAAIQQKRANIYINGSVELASDVTIPVGTTVFVGADDTLATLSIPSGIKLTVDGTISQIDGTINVLDGGELVNNGNVQVSGGTFMVEDSGNLVNNGEFDLSGTGIVTCKGSYTASENSSFYYVDDEGATFSGFPASMVYYSAMVGDVSAFETALAKAADGYKSVQINLTADITLSSSYDIPKNVAISVGDNATLTIDSDAVVSLAGTMFIDNGSKLQINNSATLVIEEGGALQLNGILVNNGTITNNGSFGTNINSYAELTAAIASNVTNLDITSSFSLAGNVEISKSMTLTVLNSTLTVPSGKTLTVYGSLDLSQGTVTVASSGKLLNYGHVNLYNRAVLSVNSGATYTQSAEAYLTFLYGAGTINGISKDKISCTVEAETESALRSGLALTGYRELNVNLYSTVVLSSNLTVPANVYLGILANPESGETTTLAVPSGRTLTCAGLIMLMDGSVLDIRTGGTLQVTSTGLLSLSGGSMKADGTVNYASGSQVVRTVYTESELIDAIAEKTTIILIAGDVELSETLSLPNGISFSIVDGGSLIVPTGLELSIGENDCLIVDGMLIVSAGATMNIPDGGSITLIEKGRLMMNGTVKFDGSDAKIILKESADIFITGETAETRDHTYVSAEVSSMPELKGAFTKYGDSPYASVEINLNGSITLDENVNVPSPVTLIVANGDTLTVPFGDTLTIDSGASLLVQDGGKLVVNGTLENNGETNLSLNDVSGTGEFIDNNGSLAFSTKVTSFAQLKTALGSGRSPLEIECSGFAITTNLTIPENVHVWFNASSTASIASGVTVTNNGILSLYGKFTISGTLINNNYLRMPEDSTLTNNGTLKNYADADVYGTMVNNGTVTVNSGCRVRFHGDAKLSGTKATGTWYSFSGKAVTGLEIVGPKYVGIGPDLKQNYIVEMIPTDAWPVDVKWSIVDGSGYAEISDETGELTGKTEGDVIIRATSLDDTIYAEMTVHIVDFSVVISGGDSVLAGKTLQLTGSFVPATTTNSKILWSLASGDTDYAFISPSGLLTAKAVTEKHIITVVASDAAGIADEARQEVTIYPAITDIRIMMDDETDGVKDITGKTLVLNSNDAAAKLVLTGIVIPSDSMEKITWSLSSTDAATINVVDDSSVEITPVMGKSQLLTLTAKSNDGSGKSASVKIQVAALSTSLTISDDLGGQLNAGGKTQLNVKFNGPQPSNKAVKWYLAPEYEAYATLSATGLLTAKAVTKAVTVQVVATPVDGGTESDPYPVTIKPVPTAVSILEDGVYVTNETLTLNLRGTPELQLTAKPWPEDASDSVAWRSSAPTVVSVDETGKITGLKAGTAMISATTAIGTKTASVKVVVASIAQAIDIYETETSKALDELRGGMSATYRVYDATEGGTKQVLPASAVNWTLDSAYAPYAKLTSSGALTTYPVSTATRIVIRAEVVGNKSAYIEYGVWIYPATQSVSLYQGSTLQTKPIVIDSYKRTLADVGADSVTLTAQKLPSDSMGDVVWTSSNMNVAQVVDGVVKPVWNGSGYNKGTAVITAKATDGTNIGASVQVVVSELVQGIKLTTTSGKTELTSGTSQQLKATIDNSTATNKAVVYSIVDGAEYATLSTSGLLTGKQVYGDRTVTVQATSVDGGAAASLEITVKPKYDEPLTITYVSVGGDISAETVSGEIVSGETISGETVSVDVSEVGAKSNLFNLSIPEAVSTTKVKWSVAPSYVASVVVSGEDTKLNYLATGTAVVTATATDVGGVVRTASFTIELYKPATSLTITPPKGVSEEGLTLASGKTMLLTGVIAPATGVTTKGVNWSIDAADADYATISSSGLVTAKAGLLEPVTIQVYAVTKNQPYCEDTIEIALTPLSTGVDILNDEKVVDGQTMTIDLTSPTLDLDAVVYADGKANPNVVWTSSNKTLATVDADGVVKGLKAGTVTVTATAADGSGKSASVKVVILTYVTGLEITSKTGFDMCGGKTLQLGVTFTPTTPTDKRITWSLSTADSQYATISAGGLLKTKALTSKVSITVVATSVQNEGAVARQVITIYPATTMVQILNSEAEVINGKTLAYDLNTLPTKTLGSLNQPSLTSGALQGVTWKSSNTAVLTISADGEIAPVRNAKTGYYNTGTVTITATAKDGSGKTATVKIVAGYLVSAISFDDGLTVAAGKTLTLKPLFDPTNVTNKKLVWTMNASDAPYATISSTGVLTAKKVTAAKDVTVYCTAQDGSGVIGEVVISITP